MAVPNGLNPNFNRASFNNGPSITGGSATGSENIVAQVGSPSIVGALYLSSNGSGEVWQWHQLNSQNTWRQINLP